jgi:hypothetical protein
VAAVAAAARFELRWVGKLGQPAGVHYVNRAASERARLTLRTYAVLNVNDGAANARRLTKCTAADPAPSMPQFKLPALA